MTKRTLTTEQRMLFAEKIMDLGNIGVGGLLVGQAVQALAQSQFNLVIALGGIVFWVLAYLFGYVMVRGGEKN
jgi:hypothetical protein